MLREGEVLREGAVMLREGFVMRLGVCVPDPLREKVPLWVLPTLLPLWLSVTPGVWRVLLSREPTEERSLRIMWSFWLWMVPGVTLPRGRPLSVPPLPRERPLPKPPLSR